VAPPSRSGSRPVRALAVLGVLILVMLISITGKDTFSPGNWHKQFKVGLGLDLSSGTQVVLDAATPKGTTPSSTDMQQAITVLLSRVNGTGNSGAQVQQTGTSQITVTVPGKAEQDVIKLISTTAKLSFRPVLLTAPYTGTSTTTNTPTAKASPSPSATPSGSATPSTTLSPSTPASASAKASTQAYAERLASPSATPTTAATATPKATASPSATPKASATPSATPSPTASAAATTYGDSTQVTKANLALFDKMVCVPAATDTPAWSLAWKKSVGYTEASDQWDDKSAQIVSCDTSGTKYVLGPAAFEGTQLTSVDSALEQNTEQWVVNLTLDGAATKSWGTLTTNLYDKYFPTSTTDPNAAALDSTAIVLDGDVQEAPETDGALTSGTFQISGPQPDGFTQDQATQLTNILKFGSLNLNFTQATINSVSPQVGSSSLSAGLLAGALGLALVILYLFYYYRGLGIVSVSSLLIAALLAYLSVVILSRFQNFSMTLSAIAGLVVAIGITADSFIVYFERLRDEVRDGKTLRPAVEAGWKRARRTILVSDTVSFLAAVLLYHFATSDVQGFAYTLGLTTLIDVIVVFLFTKPMVTLLAGTKFFSGGNKWSGLDPERLGAKTKWRSSTRRTVRTQRTPGRTTPPSAPTNPSREA
jgi:preprotein translocase subunit SecD